MTDILAELCGQIHDTEEQAVIAITGGGSGAISQLLQVAGASRTVLEAIVPYASTSLAEWLGTAAEQSCSEATARAMAMSSWMRARELAPDANPHKLIGVGATASLASDRPKRGDHRIHVATQTATTTTTHSLILSKDKRDRFAEELVCAELILLALSEGCNVDRDEALSHFDQQLLEHESSEETRTDARAEWTDLLLGNIADIRYLADFQPQVLFSGAFNPPHQGHQRMAAHAAKRLGTPVSYEISIANVDKPPLDFREIDTRLRNLQRNTACSQALLTDAPTFRRKSELFPGCTFVVGADTIQRVGDPKYYTGAEGSFDAAICQIAERGCRFLVFGREIEGEFRVLSDLTLPPALQTLCDEVTADEFRENVSSTELRDNAKP